MAWENFSRKQGNVNEPLAEDECSCGSGSSYKKCCGQTYYGDDEEDV